MKNKKLLLVAACSVLLSSAVQAQEGKRPLKSYSYVEVQGGMQIREKRPDATLVFIVPPSLEVLRERLLKRGTEAPEVVEKRVAQASRELAYVDQYDYCIVNDDLDAAIADMFSVIRAAELRIDR